MGGRLATIERTLRKRAQAAFRRLFSRTHVAARDLGAIERILLVRTDKIGDAIVSTPVLEALRQTYPRAQIDVLLGHRNKAAAPLLPYADDVLVAERGALPAISMLGRLRSRRYDLAVNLLAADSLTAALFTLGSAARVTVGFENSAAGFYDLVVPQVDEPTPFVPKLLRLLAPLNIQIAPNRARPSLTLPAASLAAARSTTESLGPRGRGLVMVNISGSSPSKFWGVARFVQCIKELSAAGFRVVLLCAPKDRASLEAIAAASAATALEPRPSLVDFAAILSLADLVISPDTSVVHIAAALGRPVVALVPTTYTAVQWPPWGVPHRILTRNTSIADIPSEDVVAAVKALAQEAVPGPCDA